MSHRFSQETESTRSPLPYSENKIINAALNSDALRKLLFVGVASGIGCMALQVCSRFLSL